MRFALITLFLLMIMGCTNQPTASVSRVKSKTKHNIVKLFPGPDIHEKALEALIKVNPGGVIEFGEGTFEFNASLSLTVSNVKVKGQGMDKTILNFKQQNQGKEGLLVSADKFWIMDLTIEDTQGDALKVNNSSQVTIQRVQTRWTRGPHGSNGGYGIYPVNCKEVLIEHCKSQHAADSGIYLGQSEDAIIRHCEVERNVAGIEIENSKRVDVHDNLAKNNTGGILVFDLPGLLVKNGKQVRVFQNKAIQNNHPNFAPKGTTVADVPPGTGMMVMATDQVELFQNEIEGNETVGLAVVSYQLLQKTVQDKEYDPYPEGTYIHDNKFFGNGAKPQGMLGMLLASVVGKPLPDVLYDGNIHRIKFPSSVPAESTVRLWNNGSIRYLNLNYPGGDLLKYLLSKPTIDRDHQKYEAEMPGLPPVHQEEKP